MLVRAINENEQMIMPMKIAMISYTSMVRMQLIVDEIDMKYSDVNTKIFSRWFLYELVSNYRI